MKFRKMQILIRKKCKLLLQNFRRVGWIISMRSGVED